MNRLRRKLRIVPLAQIFRGANGALPGMTMLNLERG
jgi:hypothetical protein